VAKYTQNDVALNPSNKDAVYHANTKYDETKV